VTQSKPERRFSKLAAAENQKAASLGQSDRVTAEVLARVFMAADQRCRYCGIELNWKGVSFDHVIPFARGGRNVEENLAACCLSCQRTKFTKSPSEHAEWLTKQVICEVCKEPFKPRFADYQRGYGKTCSRKCSGTKGGESVRNLTASPS
jgi:hypothetical protein